MPAYKNKDSGSWYVVTQYTDWTGERKQKCKRGLIPGVKLWNGSRNFSSRTPGTWI